MKNEQHGPAEAMHALADVVKNVSYKDGWRFSLDYINRPTEQFAGSHGLTLRIYAEVPNSVKPGEMTYVEHWLAVPPTSWQRDTWVRWVLDQIILVETHEAMEFYTVDGVKPYFPAHGPGRDPYEIALAPSEVKRRQERANV
jgi:hypothetical protein